VGTTKEELEVLADANIEATSSIGRTVACRRRMSPQGRRRTEDLASELPFELYHPKKARRPVNFLGWFNLFSGTAATVGQRCKA
jgi:hypothetical protein